MNRFSETYRINHTRLIPNLSQSGLKPRKEKMVQNTEILRTRKVNTHHISVQQAKKQTVKIFFTRIRKNKFLLSHCLKPALRRRVKDV